MSKEKFTTAIGPMEIIELPSALLIQSSLKLLRKIPEVREVEVMGEYRLDLEVDPMFALQWAWENTGQRVPDQKQLPQGPKAVAGVDLAMKEAWALTLGSPEVVVAVLDTGINDQHPELQPVLWENPLEIAGNQIDDDQNGYIDDVMGANVLSPRRKPLDGHGHGSHVSGTIAAAHDGLGVMGMAPQTKIMAIRAFDDEGRGNTADLIKGLDYAYRMGAKLINASFGSYEKSQIMKQMLIKLAEKNVMLIAAAGNEAQNITLTPHYPAAFTQELNNVVSVAAHTARARLSSFTNQSETLVDLAAPGDQIISTFLGQDYQVWSGTSMATPHVTGALALMLSLRADLKASELKQKLLEASVPELGLWHKVRSSGRLNVAHFLQEKKISHDQVIDLNKWKVQTLKSSWHSPHPYGPYTMISRTFSVAGARFIRVRFQKIDTEAELDKIFIRQGAEGATVETLTGQADNLVSVAVAGDTLTVEFLSDDSRHQYGFEVKELLYLD